MTSYPTAVHAATISFSQAQQLVQQQQQQRKQERYAAFQEFKTSYHDLFDAADWNYYMQATGLQLQTLLRFHRVLPEAAQRLFARFPNGDDFNALCVRTDTWCQVSSEATRATPGLIQYLTKENPGWEFRAARSYQEANQDS